MNQPKLVSLSLVVSCIAFACGGADTSNEVSADAIESPVAGSATDTSQYNFENGAQGWQTSGNVVSSAASSATRAFSGSHSLAVTLSGSSGQQSVYVASPASLPAGKTVTFEVYCPSGSGVTAIQPFALQGASANWAWTGNWQSMASLKTNAWDTLSITLPSNAVMPLAQLGVQFTASAGAKTACAIDSVSWAASSGGGTVDAGAPKPVDAGTTPPPVVDSGPPPVIDAGSPPPSGGSQAAAALVKKLRGKSNFMFGLGNDEGAASGLGVPLDLNYNYLLSTWPTWNTDADGQGAIVTIDAQKAIAMGATPAFVLYDMEDWGEAAEPSLANDPSFMTTYWSRLRILFQRLGKLGTSSLVLLEPDFWGFTYQRSPQDGSGPAQVTQAAECAGLPNTMAGLSHCYIQMRNAYSPKTAIGLDISLWGTTPAQVTPFYKALGADKMDFIGIETLDRDAGCYENTGDSECTRSVPGAYWDESNVAHPNFHDHLATVQQLTSGIGVPGVWWQTALGAPSTAAGGTRGHYRDNKVHYFFSHVNELIAAGGAGMMFGSGTSPAAHQTTVTTDNGQFKNAAAGYFAKPVALP